MFCNSEFVFCHSDFISCNSSFILWNCEFKYHMFCFISHNPKFIFCNFTFMVYIWVYISQFCLYLYILALCLIILSLYLKNQLESRKYGFKCHNSEFGSHNSESIKSKLWCINSINTYIYKILFCPTTCYSIIKVKTKQEQAANWTLQKKQTADRAQVWRHITEL